MLDISDTFDFEKSKLYAERLERKYPFLSCSVIGRSCLGRGIFSFSLGSTSNSVMIVGGTGAKSAQTSLVLYRFLDRICSSIYSGGEISGIGFSVLIKKFGITVIPCLNPDSTEPYHKALTISGMRPSGGENRSSNGFGVDIDLNFDSDWRKEKMDSLQKNIIFACDGGFPGNMKESEPETRAFTSLCKRRNFRSCLTLRTADRNAIYFNRKDKSPAPCNMMAKILAASCICRKDEAQMPACPSRWFVDSFSKPAFLLETERYADFERLYCELEEALVLMSVM